MYQPPNPRNRIGKFFLFPFFRFGYEMLLLIDYFLLGRFRFDLFLFWVFRFSIKMFVSSILDICFCFCFLFHWDYWNSSPVRSLSISFLQLHTHKASIALLILLFRILNLGSLPNLAHFRFICVFRFKTTDIGNRKSKIANQFCLFRNWKEPFSFIKKQ